MSSFHSSGTPDAKQCGGQFAVTQAEPETHAAAGHAAGSDTPSGQVRAYSPQTIHLIRTVQLNTLTLSQMADQKASILIGATFVVFSLSVSRILGAEISLSLLCLAGTAFLASLFAVLTVLPRMGTPPKHKHAYNLLFFGHFSTMSEEEWVEAVLDRFCDDETLFRTMLRDIYQNGQLLQRRKYRFLSYAYRTFLGGLLVTMIVYAGEYFLT